MANYVPSGGLAPLSQRTSDGIEMAKFQTNIFTGTHRYVWKVHYHTCSLIKVLTNQGKVWFGENTKTISSLFTLYHVIYLSIYRRVVKSDVQKKHSDFNQLEQDMTQHSLAKTQKQFHLSLHSEKSKAKFTRFQSRKFIQKSRLRNAVHFVLASLNYVIVAETIRQLICLWENVYFLILVSFRYVPIVSNKNKPAFYP